jgi:hypothetical protein
MTDSYELAKLEPTSFEHMVNALALRVLGAGHTSFAPGADAGRDGYFEGEAPYPSSNQRWTGVWYIQAKFHKPHLSSDPQKWILSQVKRELEEFKKPGSKRKWPDNWIIATNIDVSGAGGVGSFDAAIKLVRDSNPSLAGRFHFWGGRKIIDLLAMHSDVARSYGHFLTPGNVLAELCSSLSDERLSVDNIINYLVVKQFREQQFTKLEQAGSDADAKPGIHNLFIDLPFRCHQYNVRDYAISCLVRAAGKNHRIDPRPLPASKWNSWQNHPLRARVWFIRGGPGQGKSTIGQYFCQIQRAALIIQGDITVLPPVLAVAEEVRAEAIKNNHWSSVPRIPIGIELKEYAHWLGGRGELEATGVLTYLSARISADVEHQVSQALVRRALGSRSWVVVFDGLDEVPNDVKDKVAQEIRHFIEDISVQVNSDLFSVCTSRPQGYAGQFSQLGAPAIDLVRLSSEEAIRCAMPVISLGRTLGEIKKASQILSTAIQSSSVRELMTTPLQAHIMAVVVRDGGRPPDRRWQLYNNFYEVIRRREANRDLPDERIAKLLREDQQLLRAIHNRLGFALHAAAEISAGAQTSLSRDQFRELARDTVTQLVERNIEETVSALMEATANRLVLVNTPDDGGHVRFDIRSLQEFFAAEFIYDSIDSEELRRRLDVIAGDAHWREVMHFLLSALVEKVRPTEISVAIDVLGKVNEGDPENLERLLHRRLARGALLAARLLQEGVLEQDKRIRHRFRQVIEPIMGLSDFRSLGNLLRVDHINSGSWLINALLDRLKEADPTENIGAAIILCSMLPDDHLAVHGLRQHFIDAPRLYLGDVLRGCDDMEKPQGRTHGWVLHVALVALLDERWKELGVTGIRAAISILGERDEASLGSLLGEIDSGTASSRLKILLLLLRDGSADLAKEEVNYGNIIFSFIEYDWSRPSGVDYLSPGPAEDFPGILRLVYLIDKFSRVRSRDILVEIYDAIASNPSGLLGAIPGSLACFVPTVDDDGWWSSLTRKVKEVTDGEFARALRTESMGVFRLRRLAVSKIVEAGEVNVERVYEGDPCLALVLACRPRFSEIKVSSRSKKRLMDASAHNPELLAQLPQLWLGEIAVTGSRSKLRSSLLSECERHVTPKIRFDYAGPLSSAIALNLPSEMAFLPYALFPVSAPFGTIIDPGGDLPGRTGIESYVRQLIPSVPLLLESISGGGGTILQSGAAVILAVMHKEGGVRILDSYRSYVLEAAREYPEEWLLGSIVTMVALFCSQESSAARLLVNELLDIFRSNYEIRLKLQDILNRWREASRAPIESAGLQQKWLDGIKA